MTGRKIINVVPRRSSPQGSWLKIGTYGGRILNCKIIKSKLNKIIKKVIILPLRIILSDAITLKLKGPLID